MAKDLVCGMNVDEASAKHRASHDGNEYVFCGAFCREEFEREPACYLAAGYRPSMLRLITKFAAKRVRSLFPI